jgi:phage terminase large subunit-like protein
MSDATTSAVLAYNDSILDGTRPAGRWIYAAAQRFARDLDSGTCWMDWDELAAINAHFGALQLVGSANGAPFELRPWQLWALSQMWCWRDADGDRRTKIAVMQVARGNGKTTLMAGLGLWDFLQPSGGRRVYCLANKEAQAQQLVGSASEMARRLGRDGVKVLWDRIEAPDADSSFEALTNSPRSLDGLNPSLWIADEAAEFHRREALTKLVTTQGKRRDQLGVIISTPGTSEDTVYGEWVSRCRAVLLGEEQDDSLCAILYGLDPADQMEDESAWLKASPGMEYGQPDRKSVRRAWGSMKSTPSGRGEFSRYYCARMSEESDSWLDLAYYPTEPLDREALAGRRCYAGLDLSKSRDMSALVLAFPNDDGSVTLLGEYWYPGENIAQRSIDYRLPFRQWGIDGKVHVTPTAEIDYTDIVLRIKQLAQTYEIVECAYDRWGAQVVVQELERSDANGPSVRCATMPPGVRLSPGCILFENMWMGRKIRLDPSDPVMRNAIKTAIVRRDRNGNLILDKAMKLRIIDPLMAAVMAVHLWGGAKASCYEE